MGTRTRIPGYADPVTIHIRERLRSQRKDAGFSQDKLDEKLCFASGTVAGMENGNRRITASHLYQLAHALGVTVAFFFEGIMPESVPSDRAGVRAELDKLQDPMARRETHEFVRAYYAIPDDDVRRRFFEMVKAVAKSDEMV